MSSFATLAVVPALAVALVFTSAPAMAGSEGANLAPCKYEENCACAVPGITLRWKAAYCMSRAETDDLENEAVQECLGTRDPDAVTRLGPCDQNAHWKTMLCRTLPEEKAVRNCLRDKAFIPRFLEAGPGS